MSDPRVQPEVLAIVGPHSLPRRADQPVSGKGGSTPQTGPPQSADANRGASSSGGVDRRMTGAAAKARAASAMGGTVLRRGTPRSPGLKPWFQCSICLRWVSEERLAVMPIGASPWCSVCHSLDQVRGAVRDSRLSLEREEDVLEVLYRAHSMLLER